MFGVTFDGFDDGSGLWLRPLLLPDGFEGTPLRKSFVLAAREQAVAGRQGAGGVRRRACRRTAPQDPAAGRPRPRGLGPARRRHLPGEPASPDVARDRPPRPAGPAGDRPRRGGATRLETPSEERGDA